MLLPSSGNSFGFSHMASIQPSSLLLSPPSPPKTSLFHHNFSPQSSSITTFKTKILHNSLTQLTISPQKQSYFSHLPHHNPLPNHNNNYSNDSSEIFHHHHHCLHLLRLSIRHADILLGKAAHASIAKTPEDTRLANALIAMYAKLDCLADARTVFEQLLSPDVVSYTSIISAYAKHGRELEAAALFFRMQLSGIEPNDFTYVAILTACIRCGNLQFGSQIHTLAVKSNHISSIYVSNAVMGLYVKCWCLDYALYLFDEMPARDVASWNTVIAGLVQELRLDQAFELFRDMQMGGFRADHFTLSSLLTASTEAFAWVEGKEIHCHALRIGLESSLSVNNALIGFYTKCGSMENVAGLFQRMPTRDVISWTSMVAGYMEFGLVELGVETFYQMPEKNCISYNALLSGFCKNSEGSRALELFRGMLGDGVELSDFTLTSVISASAMLCDFEKSEQIHGFVTKFGCGSNSHVEAALVDMYTRCGRMENAAKMFSKCVQHQSDSIAWTSLICGYARNGHSEKAMSMFCEMHLEDGVVMDEVTLATVLGVCGTLGFDRKGMQIHCYVLKSGFLSDLGVGNAIISMYSKCGNMEDAIKIFNLIPEHDIVSWNSLITGYLLHRHGDKALDVWKTMEEKDIEPDEITFTLVLLSCRHMSSNSADTCRSVFQSMRKNYGIEPASEHYAAMVDVLGYWGCFEEAEDLIKNMPFQADALVWRALLDSCRSCSNIWLGRQAAQHLLALEPQGPSMYVLLSNLYSASGRWHCAEKVRQEMRQKGLQKHPVQSWIIHENTIHSFYARDRSHSQTKDIYSGLDILILECLKVGYVPDTSFVLHEVEEYGKKDFLFYHSAKLAVTYGLLMTSPGRPVRVIKNIHLCGDCHSFFKHVTMVTGREICLRDATGFHNFRGGECSCGDYW